MLILPFLTKTIKQYEALLAFEFITTNILIAKTNKHVSSCVSSHPLANTKKVGINPTFLYIWCKKLYKKS